MSLSVSKFFIYNDIFSSVKPNNVILTLVLYENNGNTLKSFTGVHIDPYCT